MYQSQCILQLIRYIFWLIDSLELFCLSTRRQYHVNILSQDYVTSPSTVCSPLEFFLLIVSSLFHSSTQVVFPVPLFCMIPVVAALRVVLLGVWPIPTDKAGRYVVTWINKFAGCCVGIPCYSISLFCPFTHIMGHVIYPVLTVEVWITWGNFLWSPNYLGSARVAGMIPRKVHSWAWPIFISKSVA